MMTTSHLSEAEALQQPGMLYRHKNGGIYRLLEITSIRNSNLKWKGNRDMRRGEMLMTYEHLWPHKQEKYQRPSEEFSQPDRFAYIVRLKG